MKPELVSEERLDELSEAACRDCSEACCPRNVGQRYVCRKRFHQTARAVLEDVGVGLVMEIADRKSWTACPIREDEEGECGAFHAMFPLEGVDLPTTCPVGTGDDSAVSPNCPMFTIGAVLVRAKPRPDCARKGRGE